MEILISELRSAFLCECGCAFANFGAREAGPITQIGTGFVECWRANRMSESERSALRALHDRSRDAVSVGDVASYVAANSAFHASIYASARNPYLADQVTQTRLRMRFFRHQSLSRPAHLILSWHEHERVVVTISSGDEIEAQQAMRAHIAGGGTVFADMVASIGRQL